MLEKSVSELAQSLGYAVAQIFACPFAGLDCFLPPRFNDAGGRLFLGGLEAAGVGGEPESGEIRVQAVLKQKIEIGFNVCWPRQTRIVSQNSQLGTVGDDSP